MLQNSSLQINKKDSHGVNAFWIAAYYGEIHIMSILKDKKIDIHVRNESQSNALHIATKKRNIEAVRWLV